MSDFSDCGVCSEVLMQEEPKKEALDEQEQHQGRRCQVMHYGGMLLLELDGDIFSSFDSLVHCVGEDLLMSKGIAVQFKHRFGGVTRLEQQKKRIGQVAYLNMEDRFIFYLITKKQSCFDLPTIASLTSCLKELKRLCLELGVHRLSMPKIGSGMDRMDWLQVKGAIKDVFSDTSLIVQVYFMSNWEAKQRTKQCQDSLISQGKLPPKGRQPGRPGLMSRSTSFDRRNSTRSQREGQGDFAQGNFPRPPQSPRDLPIKVAEDDDNTMDCEVLEVNIQNDRHLQSRKVSITSELAEEDVKIDTKSSVASDSQWCSKPSPDEFQGMKSDPKPTEGSADLKPSSAQKSLPDLSTGACTAEEPGERVQRAPFFKSNLFPLALNEIVMQDEKDPPRAGGSSFVRKTFSAPPDASRGYRY